MAVQRQILPDRNYSLSKKIKINITRFDGSLLNKQLFLQHE